MLLYLSANMEFQNKVVKTIWVKNQEKILVLMLKTVLPVQDLLVQVLAVLLNLPKDGESQIMEHYLQYLK